MGSPIRILHLDDNSSDATLVTLALEVGEKKLSTQIHYVQNKEEYLAALEQKDFDLILSDYRMPGYDGDQALAAARERCPEIPFIMVTGELGEELVIETLHRGATDYVLKDRMFRLVPAIERALAEAENYRRRREAEREIQKRQGELWAVIQAMHGGIMVFDIEGNVVLVNDSLVSTLGFKDASELKDNLVHLASMFELSDVEGHLLPLEEWPVSRIMRGETLDNVELKGRRNDTGREWFFSFSGRPVWDENGKQTLAVVVARDLTERKSFEEALHSGEERFSAAFRRSPYPQIISRVKDGVFLTVNDATLAFYGMTGEEMIGHSSFELGILADPQERKDLVELVARDGFVTDFLMHVKTRTKGERLVLLSVSLLSAGEEQTMLTVLNDITDRKKAEEDLRQAQRTTSEILESIQDPFYSLDSQWRFTYVNGKAEEFMNKSREELLGHTLWELFPAQRESESVKKLQRVMQTRKTLHYEIKSTLKAAWISVHAFPKADGGISVLYRDISDRKQMEVALRLSERRYSALFANRINGMAHCKVITDAQGRPVDYRIIQVNEAYEEIIGVKKADIEGRRVTEVFPEIKTYAFDYIGVYGKIALEGGQIKVEEFFEATNQYLSIYAYSPLPGEFAAIFTDVTERKRAEESLKAERARLTAILESIPEEVWYADKDGRITQVNRKVVDDFGRQLEVGGEIEKIASQFEVYRANGTPRPPDEAPPLRALHGEFIREEEEIVRVPATGELRYRLVTASPVWDSQGDVTGSVSIVRDITERKRAEEALREAALFPEENPSPALRISHEGTLLYANPASRNILQEWGFRVKEKVPFALYGPVNEALEKKRGRAFDLSVKDATYSFLVVPIVERQYANLYGRDVTEQKHAEERLKRLNEELQKRNLELDGERLKWQKLIEGIADEVWACDLEGRVSLLSLKSPTGGGPAQVNDEVLRRLLSEFEVLRPDGSLRPDEESPLQRSLKGEIVRGEEHVRMRSTGETRIRQHSCVPVRDTDGNIVGAVAIVRDVTGARQAEEKIRRLNEELEERVQQRTVALERANKELEAFSYTVSHDLKAPLRAITGFTGLLVNSSKEGVSAMAPDKQRQYMELILSSAGQMSKLIESLLTFARTQRQVPQVVRVNMLQLAEQVVQEQLQVLGEAAGRVRVHMREMPLEAHGDPVLLKQVYANLISNAFKFTRKQEEPEVEIGGYERDGQLVYFVRDNGAGFPSEKVQELFQVFRRLHGQAEFEGTGIGLATVRKIVERHGGEVCAEGEDGKGATFYFALPANL